MHRCLGSRAGVRVVMQVYMAVRSTAILMLLLLLLMHQMLSCVLGHMARVCTLRCPHHHKVLD